MRTPKKRSQISTEWRTKAGYKFSVEKATTIYTYATSQVNTLPMTDAIKSLVTLAATQLNTIIETICVIQHEMAHSGFSASRVPYRDTDVWRRPSAWPSAYGRNW